MDEFVDDHELEQAFKAHLASKGIPTFGPVAKHYLRDPRGVKMPHAPRQQPHGRRPGKRVLMTGIRALANKKPDLDLPKWNEMLRMEHHEVLAIFEEHFGEVKPAKGAGQKVVRVVENDPNNPEGFKREEERARTDAKTMQAAGRAGQNLRVDDFDVSAALAGKKPKEQPRDRERPKTRRPGRDVVDYNREGFANERTRAREANVRDPEARGNYNRNEESRMGPESVARREQEEPRRERQRPAPRPAPQAAPRVPRRPAPAAPPKRPAPQVQENWWDIPGGDTPVRDAPAAAEAKAPKADTPQLVRAEVVDERNRRAKQLLEEAGVANEGVAIGGNLPVDGIARRLREAAEGREAQIGGGRRAFKPTPEQAAALREAADVLEGKKDAPAAAEAKAPAARRQPDGAATAAARREGVPRTDNFREMGTKDRVQFREFHQNKEEVERGLQAAQDEVARNVEANKNVDVARIAGRELDAIAAEDRELYPLDSQRALNAARVAYAAAEDRVKRAGGKFIAPKDDAREVRINRLAERYNIRHRGKPEGTAEEGRAREIDRHEKFREAEDARWQRGGRVRDKLKEPAAGETDVPDYPRTSELGPQTDNANMTPPGQTREPRRAGTATDVGAKNPAANTEQREANRAAMSEAGRRLVDLNVNGPASEAKQKALQAIHYGGFDAAAKRMYNGVVRGVRNDADAKNVANRLRTLAAGKEEKQKKALMDAANALSPMPSRLTRAPEGGAVDAAVAPGAGYVRLPERVKAMQEAFENASFKHDAGYVGGNNLAGRIPAGHVTGADGEQVKVIAKPDHGNPPQERFAHDMFQVLGADHMMPVVGIDKKGNAIMEFVEGNVANELGIGAGADQARRELARRLVKGGMDPQAAARKAGRDLEILLVGDFINGNGDRHGGNVMVGPDGQVRIIDNGLVGYADWDYNKGGPRTDPNRPLMRRSFQQGADGRRTGERKVSPEMIEKLKGINREDIRRMAGNLRNDLENGIPAEDEQGLKLMFGSMNELKKFREYLANGEYEENVWNRIQFVIENGKYHYEVR